MNSIPAITQPSLTYFGKIYRGHENGNVLIQHEHLIDIQQDKDRGYDC